LIQKYFLKYFELFRAVIDESREITSIEHLLLESAQTKDFSL
jgi:hypothetical protein